MNNRSLEINIGWGFVWRVIFVALLVLIVFIAREIFIATLLAIIISSALDPFVTYLSKKRVPRILGTLIIYILVLLGISLLVYIILPVFLVELNNFINSSIQSGVDISQSGGLNLTIFETFSATANEFIADLSQGTTTLLSLISQVLGGLATVAIIVVISFYLTIGRDGVERFLITILPMAYQPPVLSIYERTRKKISHWLVGQLFLSLIIGITTYIGLLILGVKYAFILAITAAILELVPYVGPIFSGFLAMLAAFSTSPILALYTLIFFVIIQQIEQHLLIPSVMKYTTNLNPVIIIISLLIGGKVFGILGIILAVPVAVAVQEVIQYFANIQQSKNQGVQQTLMTD